MEWKNWNPREGKIANEDLITEFLESLAVHDASSSKFLKIVENQKISILTYCLIYSSYQLHTLVYYTRPCPTVM